MASFGTPSYGGSASGSTLNIAKPADLVDNCIVVIAARSSDSATSVDWTPPSGFTRQSAAPGTLPNAGTRTAAIWTKTVTSAASEPANYTLTGPTGRSVGIAVKYVPDEAGTLTMVGASQYGGNGSTSGVASVNARTLSAAPAVSFLALAAECTVGISHVPSTLPTGYTTLGNAQHTYPAIDTTGTRTAIWLGYLAEPDTSVDAVTGGFSGATASGAYGTSLKAGGTAVTPIGVPIKIGTGATAYLSYLDGSGVRKAPTRVAIWLPGFADVNSLLAKPGATIAHRGGSLNWPEFSEVAYDRCVYRGQGALEFSCGWTSDLVPFGLGDQYLDRAAGVTGSVDPTTMTWATLSSTYQNKLRPISAGVYQPFYRLDQFLAKYTPNRVVAVDPKFGFATTANVNQLISICNANGGPSKIIIKFDSPTTSTTLLNAAQAAGYKTMNYWGTDASKLTTTYNADKWDILGVQYDADKTTVYDVAKSFGKPVWAAVIPDQAGYATAASRGADLMMCSNVSGITPVGP